MKQLKFIALLIPVYFFISYTNPEGFMAEYGKPLIFGLVYSLLVVILPVIVLYGLFRLVGFASIKQTIEYYKNRKLIGNRASLR